MFGNVEGIDFIQKYYQVINYQMVLENRAILQTINSLKHTVKNQGFSFLRLHFVRSLNSSSANLGKVFDKIFPLK